jgi:hypothetical protein
VQTNPIIGFLKTLFLYITGHVDLRKSNIGKEFIMNDGLKFKVFRHVIIRPLGKREADPQAVFIIRFQPKNMTVEENKRFSRIPMLIFMGFHGFRAKYWMVNEETGLCQGVYEWDAAEDAFRYAKSIALKFMIKRSVHGTVDYKINVKKDASDCIPFLLPYSPKTW